MSNLKLPVKIGYADGSGEDYLTDADDQPLAVVRWGCGCCKSTGPLTDEERGTLETIRDALNARQPRTPVDDQD